MTPRKEGSGIVERLRAKKRTLLTRNGLHGTIEEFRNPDGPEAATHIEAQDAEIKVLREALEGLSLAVDLRALRGRDHVPSMRAEQDAQRVARLALSRAKASGDGMS